MFFNVLYPQKICNQCQGWGAVSSLCYNNICISLLLHTCFIYTRAKYIHYAHTHTNTNILVSCCIDGNRKLGDYRPETVIYKKSNKERKKERNTV